MGDSAVKKRFARHEEDEPIKNIRKFDTALSTAMQIGQENFKCPLCGGAAWWSRASSNGHLHAGCKDCNFMIME